MKRFFFCCVFAASLLLAGLCQAQDFWSVPDLPAQLKGIRTVQLITPEIKVFEITAGGISEWKDDWSNTARKNIIDATSQNLQTRGISLNQTPVPREIEGDLADIKALYMAASSCIRAYATGDNSFPTRGTLDYSVGPVNQLLAKSGADAFLIINARDQISSSGRQALMATGILIGALTGVVAVPRGGAAAVDMALIGPSGKILWYRIKLDGTSDLRDYDSSRKFISDIFTSFPIVK